MPPKKHIFEDGAVLYWEGRDWSFIIAKEGGYAVVGHGEKRNTTGLTWNEIEERVNPIMKEAEPKLSPRQPVSDALCALWKAMKKQP